MGDNTYSYDEYKNGIYKKVNNIKNILYGKTILPYYPKITTQIKYKMIGELIYIEKSKIPENEKLVMYYDIIHDFDNLK